MLPICILTIQDEDDRAYMSRLFVQYHRLMYQCTYEVLDTNGPRRMPSRRRCCGSSTG